MKNNRTRKTLTLFSFVILLTCFIAFKSGTFDKYLDSEDSAQLLQADQAGNQGAGKGDTSISDSMKTSPTMLSTSKSLMLPERKMLFPVSDTSKKDSLRIP